MTPTEQLADLATRCDLLHSVQARQVPGGFILAGSTRYVERGTGAVLAERNAETIAPTAKEAGNLVTDFITNGSFPV